MGGMIMTGEKFDLHGQTFPNVTLSTTYPTYEGSPKRNRTFFLNLLLYLELNQTCLLHSTPLYCWYTAPSVFSYSGTSWNVFCGMARRSCSEFSFISSTVWNRRPFRADFNFGNREKSARTLPSYRKQILHTLWNLLFLNNPSLGYVICVVEYTVCLWMDQ
jgi:hypothetical protein